MDHIPPKGMFARPLPGDLITVPACEACKKSFETDDTYFRDCVALDHRSGNDPDAIAARESAVRNLKRLTSWKYSSWFLAGLGRRTVRTESGLHLGSVGTFNVDLGRIERTLQRIVVGLHFHEFGVTLPESLVVRAALAERFDALPASELVGLRDAIIDPTLRSPVRESSRGVLRYWVATARDRPEVTSWVLQFYGGVTCVAGTLPGEAA